MRVLPSILLLVVVSASALLAADVYDIQSVNDNAAATTRNELSHGVEQWHDLAVVSGVLDQDWFRVRQQPYSSYEVIVDSVSGDLSSLRVSRVGPDGVTILQHAVAAGLCYDRSLRFANTTGAAVDGEYIVVRNGSCTVPCGSDDVYRIRLVETTAAIARFNNSGTQTTVVLLQNPSAATVSGAVYFWNSAGAQVATSPFTLTAKAQLVLNTAVVVPVSSTGSITIAHDARHGDLAGKAVGLEPSTGFSFDTPMVHRPR
jgi:hypothetical protein